MSMKSIKLVATDLDGTFLKDDHSISPGNLDALHSLGHRQIVRVVATGRNLRKVMEVIPREVPFDYIVYSSGAGIYNWKEQQHIFQQNISRDAALVLTDHFREREYNFYVFAPAPVNHRLWYYRGKRQCEEFNRYYEYHRSHSGPLVTEDFPSEGICQFLLIIPEDEIRFEQLKGEIENRCGEIRVIRSSSPVTKGFIWVEVFHRDVSKGHGVKHICDLLDIHPRETFGIGNDYNDIDLLNFTAYSFLTENAPPPIKGRYIPLPSNEHDAFAHAIKSLLN